MALVHEAHFWRDTATNERSMIKPRTIELSFDARERGKGGQMLCER